MNRKVIALHNNSVISGAVRSSAQPPEVKQPTTPEIISKMGTTFPNGYILGIQSDLIKTGVSIPGSRFNPKGALNDDGRIAMVNSLWQIWKTVNEKTGAGRDLIQVTATKKEYEEMLQDADFQKALRSVRIENVVAVEHKDRPGVPVLLSELVDEEGTITKNHTDYIFYSRGFYGREWNEAHFHENFIYDYSSNVGTFLFRAA